MLLRGNRIVPSFLSSTVTHMTAEGTAQPICSNHPWALHVKRKENHYNK